MAQHHHTNIMLDLEITDITSPDPAIIELAAVHFDLSTGEELDHISMPVNLQSCLDHGLKKGTLTLNWLRHHIPQTLETRRSCSTSLPQALSKLTQFVNTCHKSTQAKFPSSFVEPMIWGNGVVADNVWIRSAYKACKMQRPWKDFGDMCVRTFVKQGTLIMGVNRARTTPRTGVLHKALDDCKHQIKYIVLTRNDLVGTGDASDVESEPIEQIARPLPSSAGAAATSKRQIEQISAEHDNQQIYAAPVPTTAGRLLNPLESSISGKMLASKEATAPEFVAPKLPITPEASFTETDSSQDAVVGGPPSKKARLSPVAEPPAEEGQKA